jgi:hypothetical protein
LSEDNPDAQQRKAAEELERTTKVVAKIAWVVFALMVVATVVFWFGWVRAPSPEKVCQHKVELVFGTVGTEQREGAEALVSQLELRCAEGATTKIRMQGKLVYAKYAKCVMAATTLDEAERC